MACVGVCVCVREKAGGDTLTSSDSGFQLSKASFNSMSDVGFFFCTFDFKSELLLKKL